MSPDDRARVIYRGTPESAAMLANVKRAMAITARLNRLTFNEADEIRALFSELIRKTVDDGFLLIPPFYAAGGDDRRNIPSGACVGIAAGLIEGAAHPLAKSHRLPAWSNSCACSSTG